MPGLTILTGEQAGTHFELANRPLSVGRDPSRDIQVLDPKVSRKHAIIRHAGDDHTISATKALNGLLINNAPADGEIVLKEGDQITMGDTVLQFSKQSAPDMTDAVNMRKNADRKARDANTMM